MGEWEHQFFALRYTVPKCVTGSSEQAPLSPIILLRKKSVDRSAVLPLRKKYHSVQLLVCKRTRYAELSLTTFWGMRILLPQIFHRNICGGTIALWIQLRGTFLREKSSPNPSKDRFVKSVPLSADSGLRLCLWKPQAWMLDNGHTKSLSKEAYKWSNRVGARCTDHIRPQMQRCSDTNDRMQARWKGLSETFHFVRLVLSLKSAVSISPQRYYLSKGGIVSGDSPPFAKISHYSCCNYAKTMV